MELAVGRKKAEGLSQENLSAEHFSLRRGKRQLVSFLFYENFAVNRTPASVFTMLCGTPW